MLTAELKTKWLSALRSGKYKQGQYLLRDRDNCYCPLGVLMEVSGLGEWEAAEGSAYRYRMPADHNRFTNRVPCELVSQSRQSRITRLNDFGRMPFAAIADWIEENVPTED